MKRCLDYFRCILLELSDTNSGLLKEYLLRLYLQLNVANLIKYANKEMRRQYY